MVRKVLLGSCLFGGALWAQQAAAPTETLDSAFLRAEAAQLLSQARTAQYGVASKVYLKRAESSLTLAMRVKSGQGEWHRDDADIMIGVEGSARITIGGEIVNGKETVPGEIRGDGVKGGKTQPFKAGDVIRIEPQVAHQILLQPGTTFRYMTVKVKAAPVKQ